MGKVNRLTWSQAATLAFVNFSVSLVITVVFPFAPRMVLTFGLTDDEREIGYYAGFIASALFFGRFVSSSLWGYLSDRIGRKPVMLICFAGVSVFMGLFAFSPNFAVAVISRFFSGLFNGVIGTIKVIMSDLCNQSTMAFGMGLISSTYSSGLMLGPAIGGILSEPADKYGWNQAILVQFPYVLPSLIVSGFCAISFVVFWIFGVESLAVKNVVDSDEENLEIDVEMSNLNTESEAAIVPLDSEDEKSEQEKGTHSKQDEPDVVPLDESVKDPNSPLNPEGSVLLEESKEATGGDNKIKQEKEREPLLPVYKQFWPMFAVGIYSLFGLIQTLVDECFVLFGLSARSVGGLGWDTTDLGIVIGVGGLVTIIWSLLIFPRIEKKIGVLTALSWALFLMIPIYFLIPFVTWTSGLALNRACPPGFACPQPNSSEWIFVSIFVGFLWCFRAILSSTAFTSIFIIINNSVTAEQRGTINGFAMTTGSLTKAIAPELGSVLYSWSLTGVLAQVGSGIISAPFVFYFTCVWMLLAWLGSRKFPPSLGVVPDD